MNQATEKPSQDELKRRRAAWIAALRSGKYQQTKGALCRIAEDGSKSYCCLGIGCVVAIELGLDLRVGKFGEKLEFGMEWKTVVMPEEVIALFGMKRYNGGFYGYRLDKDDEPCSCLSELNDHGFDFSQIADFIESNPPGLWQEDK